VADLTQSAPFVGLTLPVKHGRAQLAGLPVGPMFSIAPFAGARDGVAQRLGGFPDPGQITQTAAGPLVWAGRETAFLFGTPPDLTGLAGVTDQSDGWAGLRLTGQDATAVLARLLALDLDSLPPGAGLRAQLNHLPVLLIHPVAEVFDLWSYRSMAGTMLHEIEGAMRGLAARRMLTGQDQG